MSHVSFGFQLVVFVHLQLGSLPFHRITQTDQQSLNAFTQQEADLLAEGDRHRREVFIFLTWRGFHEVKAGARAAEVLPEIMAQHSSWIADGLEDDGCGESPGSPDCDSLSQSQLSNGWQMVVNELLQTERSYVNDLQEVVDGYCKGLSDSEPEMSSEEWSSEPITVEEKGILFGNIRDLLEFNSRLLESLEAAASAPQPTETALCFLSVAEDLKIYAKYCMNFVKACDLLSSIRSQRPEAADYFQRCQTSLGHTLPLDSYLLKPVQRILKYPLLLRTLMKQYASSPSPCEEAQLRLFAAHKTMSELADYINQVKETQELEKRARHVLSNLKGCEEQLETGPLHAHDQIRVQCAKSEPHHIYAFEDAMLITKPMREGPEQYKGYVKYSDVLLVDDSAEPFHFDIELPEEQLETGVAKLAKMFPIAVCPRNAKQKAMWMKVLHDKNVPDMTADPERRRRMPGDGSSPFKPRQTFVNVIHTVQRASSFSRRSPADSPVAVRSKSPTFPVPTMKIGSPPVSRLPQSLSDSGPIMETNENVEPPEVRQEEAPSSQREKLRKAAGASLRRTATLVGKIRRESHTSSFPPLPSPSSTSSSLSLSPGGQRSRLHSFSATSALKLGSRVWQRSPSVPDDHQFRKRIEFPAQFRYSLSSSVSIMPRSTVTTFCPSTAITPTPSEPAVNDMNEPPADPAPEASSAAPEEVAQNAPTDDGSCFDAAAETPEDSNLACDDGPEIIESTGLARSDSEVSASRGSQQCCSVSSSSSLAADHPVTYSSRNSPLQDKNTREDQVKKNFSGLSEPITEAEDDEDGKEVSCP